MRSMVALGLGICVLALMPVLVSSEKAFWRGTKRAKQCKMCQFIVKQISKEQTWPSEDEAVKELYRSGKFCVDGKPRKGRPVLAHFDNPPSFQTWKEVGSYCQDVAAQMDNAAIRAWKNDPESFDDSVYPLTETTYRFCGSVAPGIGVCDPAEAEYKPKIKAGIDLVPKLVRKEGEGLPGQATTVQSAEDARLKRIADAKERDAKRAAERKQKAEEEEAEAERKKQTNRNKKKKKKKKDKKTVEDVVHNKEL